MEDEEIEKMVIAYLKKKGFKQTELALQEEQSKSSFASQTDPDKQILSVTESESGPAQYQDGYSKLRSWTYSSLDLYKYSYELLVQYLQKSQSITILGIINEHINFEVSPGQPSTISDDADVVTLLGSSHDTSKLINQKEIRWGLLEDSLEERLEKAGALMSDSEKPEGETKEGEVEENKKKSVDGGKQGASVKKLKKDKVVGTTGKSIRSETNIVSMAPRVKPELSLPEIPTEVEHSILEDLRNRVQLGSLALPSVSFYTFINTHNGLNCSSISHDGSLVAGGFSDSSVKVWDMSKIGQQSDTSIMQGENDSASIEHLMGPEDGKRSYTLFQGHAGPVYSVKFSPLGDFILSSSADSTIRLWSTKLNANLVCYKGHNYPVWDVQKPLLSSSNNPTTSLESPSMH